MRRLAVASFSFSAAVFLCNYILSQSARLFSALVCLGLFCAAVPILKGKRRLLVCLISAGLCAGFFWTHAYEAVIFRPARALDDQTVRLTAVVTDYPRERDYGWQVSVRAQTEQGSLNMLLFTDAQGADLRPGDRIESVTHCTLGTLSSTGEEITYYTAKGIFLWGTCYGTLRVDSPERIPLRFWPAQLAHRLRDGIDAAFPESAAGIVRAVVTGSRDKLTDEFTSSLERTGLSHVVAVSGMHLSCFAGLLALLLGRGRRQTALIVTAWAVLFTGIAGSTPSVSRAAVMIFLLQLAPLLGRERDDLTALGFALMLLLLWNPYSAAHVGLQLSFAAVAGIFLAAGPVQRRVMEKLGLLVRVESRPMRLLRDLAGAAVSVLCTTLGAMLFTVPLTALHFQTLSLIAPITNLLSLWAVTGVFALGLLVGCVGILLPGLGQILAVPVAVLARYVDVVTGYFSGLTFSALSLDSPYYRLWLVFAYLLLFAGAVHRGKRRVVIPVCCTLIALCTAMILTAHGFDRGAMTVTALDVGQGQSILLRLKDRLVLVDCGGDAPDNAGDLAADYIQSRGRSTVDFLVLTHFHDDHANGVAQLLSRVRVDNLLIPDVEPDSPIRAEILALAHELDIPVRFVRTDTDIALGAEGTIKLYPPLVSDGDTNELGLTALASAGEFDVLITGDMSSQTEQLLLDYAGLSDIELLVAGHHGAKTATSPLLLARISPEVCFISAGARNRYGHPHEDTLSRISGIGAELYRTDINGTVTLTLNQS